MKYLKIYENYFSDRDEIDELYIKKEDDFVQEVLDLIPDICSLVIIIIVYQSIYSN